MIKRLLRLRFIYLIAVIFTLINSLFFLVSGAIASIKAYAEFFELWNGKTGIRPGLHLMESLDSFLIALVFLIFSLGIMKIFTHYHVQSEDVPSWLRLSDFKELKVLLWEAVLVTLVVLCIELIVRNVDSMGWNMLVLPGIILILSLSLYFMRGHDKKEP